MRFFSTLLPLAVATGAFAKPVLQRGNWNAPAEAARDLAARSSTTSEFNPIPIFGCMQPWQATNIVNAFLYLLANPTAANFNATADALLASDYTDTSDSIDQLAGLPEGTVTFTSRDAFIAASIKQPPLYLQTLDTFNSCNKISWRWISINGTGDDAEKVKGIDVFVINQQGQIESTYAEFNSGAWLVDLGKTDCIGGP